MSSKNKEKRTKAPSSGKLKKLLSTLPKKWHNFLVLADKTAILSGEYNLCHKRYKGHTTQGAAVSILCCAITKLVKIEDWCVNTLSSVLDLGVAQHINSLKYCKLEIFQPPHIFKYFYIKDMKYTMFVGTNNTRERLYKESDPLQTLVRILTRFFFQYESGIISCQNKFFTIWRYKTDDGYFIFDPTEHELDGTKWTGIPSYGHCFVLRCNNIQKIAERIIASITIKEVTQFDLFPCYIEKAVKVNILPPETLENIEGPKVPILSKSSAGDLFKHTLPKKTSRKSRNIVKEKVVEKVPSKTEVELKAPPERPKIKSVTNFLAMGDGMSCGILRASSAQPDQDYSFYNALAALTMLRIAKSKKWIPKVLDYILEIGRLIRYNSLKLSDGAVIQQIPINNKIYEPIIDKLAYKGQLQSDVPHLLDLLPALSNFLIANDCCIIKGPEILAVWVEERIFYMFDPNQRNKVGEVHVGAEGTACVTWFKTLKELVRLYMSNLQKKQMKDSFTLINVKVEDYVEKPKEWYNFQPITAGKWILRGRFSQGHDRFGESKGIQCTAMSAIALAYAQLQEEKDWDTNVVDKVLLSGNEFYNLSVDALKAKEKFYSGLLMVDEVLRQFLIGDKVVDFEINDCLVNGLLTVPSDKPDILDLQKGFEEFFVDNDYGIVTAKNQSMAVWKKDDAYYYFDSHPRNRTGFCCAYGTAFVLRLLSLEDVVKALTTNLGASKDNFYNISRVVARLTETNEEGVLRPPLNNYTALNDYVAILRSNVSTVSNKFDLNAGKQTVPMALMALAFNDLTPSFNWSQTDIDKVMELGDELYYNTMEMVLNAGMNVIVVPEEGAEDEIPETLINSENVKRDFTIAGNQYEIEFDEAITGNYDENLREALENLYAGEKFQALFESDYLQVVLWRDEHLIYLFDAKPRDKLGQVYGKEDWPIMPEEIEEEEEEEEEGGEENGDENEKEKDDEEEAETGGGGDNLNNAIIQDDEDVEDEEEREASVIEEEPPKGLWKPDEAANGRACLLRFARLDDLIGHILDNSPEPDRPELTFTIKPIQMKNSPQVREIFDPEYDEKLPDDNISGPWFNFEEMDHGKWILRGTKRMTDELFPEHNRGRQQIAMCLNVFVFVKAYSLERFKSDTVDNILMYGDRSYTAVRKIFMKIAAGHESKTIMATALLENTNFTLKFYPRQICIFEKKVTFTRRYSIVSGDIKSELDEVCNLPRGVKKLFEDEQLQYGIIVIRDYYVSIWLHDNHFYMFDPHQCSSSGNRSPIGVPCITRFQTIEELCALLLENIPNIGANFFEIHGILLDLGECERERQPKEPLPPPAKLSGFLSIIPGKQILRGEWKQDFLKFEKGVHAQGCAISFVALAMTLVQKVETWTKLVIDQILKIGDQLHHDSIERMGAKFNPWVHKLTIVDILNDFKIGSTKVNCVLRHSMQEGIVDIKYPSEVLNLRRGIERFFEENTHGIIRMGQIYLAIWEDIVGNDQWIYLYDPNSRGLTGLPTAGGVACSIKFCNAKLATEHIFALLMGYDKEKLVFVIDPVELLVGGNITLEKVKNLIKPCESPAKQAHRRLLRNIAQVERMRAKAKKEAQLGRTSYVEAGKDTWVIRGTGTILEHRDFATNLVAYVVMKLYPMEECTFKNIDTIIEVGNQVYMESLNYNYTLFGKYVGYHNCIRTFYFKQYSIHLNVFKPMEIKGFTPERVARVLNRIYEKNTYCMLSFMGQWVGLLVQNGFYYYFDPYGCCLNGKRIRDGGSAGSGNGNACFIKFGSLDAMVIRVCDNLWVQEVSDEETFSILLIKMISSDIRNEDEAGNNSP